MKRKRAMIRRVIVGALTALMILAGNNYNLPIAEAKTSSQPVQQYANIVLFAHFAGENAQSDAQFFADNRDTIKGFYDGQQGRSLKNYLSTISYGQFQVVNIFPQDDGTTIRSCELPFTEEEARGVNIDDKIIQAVMASVPEIQDQVLDYNGDGAIDNVTIILKGGSNEDTHPSEYPHKSTYAGSEQWSGNLIRFYNILNTWRMMERTNSEKSGMIAHEFLHSIGYPDLYNVQNDNPVYTWDIMSSALPYVSYPLAYMRMAISGWLEIDTVMSSRTLTLDLQSKADGNQAYILKSPLNENEVFVVEFRKQAERKYNDEDSLDAKIGGSGVIVYRVDLTSEDLSNYHGNTSVYVFRPQKGQNGYNENSGICVQNAYLSEESGRTSIGTADMTKTLEDGALTYSDGTNSGIVIRHVSSSAGDQMTLDVSIPKASDYDAWTDTEFINSQNQTYVQKKVAMGSDGSTSWILTYESGSLKAYGYENGTWNQKGQTIACSMLPSDMKIFCYNGNWYFGCIDGMLNSLDIYSYNAGQQVWSKITALSYPGSDFDVTVVNGVAYLTYIKDSMSAELLTFDGTKLVSAGRYFYETNEYCGQPKVTGSGNTVYVSVRMASGNKIRIYSYDGGFREIQQNHLSSNTYDIYGTRDKLYVALGGDALTLYEYQNGVWGSTVQAPTDSYEPMITEATGTIYVMATPSTASGNIRVYAYKRAEGKLVQEGINVDGTGYGATVIGVQKNLMVSYVQNLKNTIIVKRKEVQGEGTSDPGSTPGTNPPSTEPTPSEPVPIPVPNITVSYQTHVQDYGWQNYVSNGTVSGTYGESKRLEGIHIKVAGNSNLGIQYSTHVQDYGWQPWCTDGDMSGTEGEAKRLEAIVIQLTGSAAKDYDVYYRVHAQDYGWLDWAKNGAPAGTAALSKRLEAIQIVVVKKGEGAGYDTTRPYISGTGAGVYIAGAEAPVVKYRTHVQDYGWQNYRYNGEVSGTYGESKRLEGINIYLNNKTYSGGICYQTHVQDYGWQGWRYDGAMSGTSGESKRLEAIRLQLTGEMANHYDIYYRVHAQDYGWLDWAKNGAPAGTAGLSKRLEGIQIVIVPKGSAAPGRTERPFVQG